MQWNGYIITRDLTDEERAEINEKLSHIGSDVVVPQPGNDGAQPPFSPPVGNLLNGWVPYGGVEIRWTNGVPNEARLVADHNNRADVPPKFWDDVTQHAHQDQWAPFAYIAFLESRYNETSKVMDTNNEYARGYMQVNGVWPQYDNDSLLVGPVNISAAQDIFDQQGYGAWLYSARTLGLI